MRVTVRIIGGLVHTLGFGERELDLAPGTTAAALLAGLGIENPRSVITTRGGVGISPDEEIEAGDRLLVSPPFSGG